MDRYTEFAELLQLVDSLDLQPGDLVASDADGTLWAADIADMGGTDFKGGVGDYLLRNDVIEAVILAVDETPDFGVPIVSSNVLSFRSLMPAAICCSSVVLCEW